MTDYDYMVTTEWPGRTLLNDDWEYVGCQPVLNAMGNILLCVTWRKPRSAAEPLPKLSYSLGEAIEWMMDHVGEEMIDSEDDIWRYDGDEFYLNDHEDAASATAPFLRHLTFTVLD